MQNSIKSILQPAVAIILTLGYLIVSPSISIAQSTNNVSMHQPGYYRMQVGDFEVTALSDGTIPQDLIKLLINARPGEVNQLLELNYLKNPVETSVNAYLISIPSAKYIFPQPVN